MTSRVYRVTYDPADPAPYPRALDESDDDAKKVRSVDELRQAAEGAHISITDLRSDILVFTTSLLETLLTFAGPIFSRT